VAKEFEKENDVIVAKVDCSESSDLKTKYGITDLPANRFFSKGGDVNTPDVHTGGDSAAELVEYVYSNLNPSLKQLKALAGEIHSSPAETRKKIDQLVDSNKESKQSDLIVLFSKFAAKIEKDGAGFVPKVLESFRFQEKPWFTQERIDVYAV